MHIASVRIENYKSFRDSGNICLTPGFNVVVGRNDAGKSALLEALSHTSVSKPHRSLQSIPHPWSVVGDRSLVTVNYTLTAADIHQLLTNQLTWHTPLESNTPDPTLGTRFKQAAVEGDTLTVIWENSNPVSAGLQSLADLESSGTIQFTNTAYPSGVELRADGRVGNDRPSFGLQMGAMLKQRVFAFRAERLNVGECATNGGLVLQSNAQNLAEVLNKLTSWNPSQYERFLAHVRTVFPHITHVASPTMSSGVCRILIWTVDPGTERADLAVPLAESGTGIGQVLAILYAVVTAQQSNIIIVDEPQSFLHPGAVRKLLEILRGYPQHQYIISSHTPVALTATGSDTLLLASREDGCTKIELIDANNQQDVRAFLADVGMRLGDVFGADSILWVEGRTEEACFPELLRDLTGTPLAGIQILGLVSTDELGTKNANRVFDIYSTLSGSASLLPPAVAFVLDRENRSDAERRDIEHKSGNKMTWLPLRMYENYLIDPAALLDTLNTEDVNRPAPLTIEALTAWLADHAVQVRYFHGAPAAWGTAEWTQRVNGAKLLHDLFTELSDTRVAFDKVKHGLALTRYLIRNPTHALSELADMLKGIALKAAVPAQA